jgi:hypothetical protein
MDHSIEQEFDETQTVIRLPVPTAPVNAGDDLGYGDAANGGYAMGG